MLARLAHSGQRKRNKPHSRSTGNSARPRTRGSTRSSSSYIVTVPREERVAVLGQLLAHQTLNVTALGLFHYVNPTMIAN